MPSQFVLAEPGDVVVEAPVLDDDQRAVVAHPGGPLLVLAGPGTGKTTTLVELVVDRVEQGLSPDEVLVLTFSRKAAGELRSRIAQRLDRTTATATAMTFHAFCYAMLRAEQSPTDYASPIRLLSAPEHDAVVHELLAGTDPERWPEQLRPALRTRGMTTELQRLVGSARAQGLDARALEALGEAHDRDDWVAAGRFFDELAGVAALANTIDHTDLVLQAVRALDLLDVRARWRDRFSLVVVDEYQDTDPLQVELLQALAGDGRDLVVVGDPYQSIYGFRGADVRGILDFPQQFRVGGEAAPTLTLGHTRRYGADIAAAVRSVVENKGAVGPVDGDAFARLRSPDVHGPDGSVQVRTFASPTAEAEHVALELREEHLHRRRPWSDMAVLVRSGAHVGRLQRALTAAGVPVEVAGDEIPLARESAVRTLIGGVHAADALRRDEHLGPDVAEALLSGPLGGADAGVLRRLGRVLRRAELEAGREVRPSRLLVAEALSDATWLRSLAVGDGPDAEAVAAAARLAVLLRSAAEQMAAGGSVEQVLWTLWHDSGWERRLEAEALSTGDSSARAHHDLDALCALFAEAARAEEQQTRLGIAEVVAKLEAQEIPADTLAQQAGGGEAVQIMTGHRSKGLEWPVVVVAGVQDGEWPDVRLRSSLLQGHRLSPAGVLPPPSARTAVAEERRLFYVACSRARERLLVTAVASGDDAGDQPSRFVTELHAATGGEGRLPVPEHRPRRALSLRGAVGELRRLGETTDDPAVRARCATLLARLGAHPAARAAHPDRWWGLRERTAADAPVADPERPVALSASAVSTLTECPLKWFLSRKARGERGTTSAQGFGSVVHAIAADVVRSGEDPDPATLAEHLDEVWEQLEYPAWIGAREKGEAVDAIGRFAQWHRASGREVLAAEHEFRRELDVDGRAVVLQGSMDRVERDDSGVHVIDLKTSKSSLTAKDVAEHPQLGFYQVAVTEGAVDDLVAGGTPGGAELVYLRLDASAKLPDHPKVVRQPAAQDHTFFAYEQLRRSVHAVDTEEFPATESASACGWCQFRRACPAQDEGASIVADPS